MKSSLRLQPEFDQVITEAVDEYMREVRHAQRLMLRQVVIDTCQIQGLPVFEGDEMETHIDVLEALITAGHDDPDQILHLMSELPVSPNGKLWSDQILQHLEPYLVEPEPLVTNADLDQYRFEVTGKISTRCTKCRRGSHRTQQQFTHNRFLQRILLGYEVTCPYCRTGHIKVYGVRAVLRDHASLSQEKITPANTEGDRWNKNRPTS